MRYALLICTDESATAAASPEETAATMSAYDGFGAEMAARGSSRAESGSGRRPMPPPSG